MHPTLRKHIIAAGTSALLIAAALGSWYEGRRHEVYLDVAGVPTVCDGITGRDVIPGKVYTDFECDALQLKHLKIAEAHVDRVVKVPLTPWQKAALIDFTFNLGGDALAGSTMARYFNARDYTAGCRELAKWTKARVKGVLTTLRGLVLRRADEMEICLNGSPQ